MNLTFKNIYFQYAFKNRASIKKYFNARKSFGVRLKNSASFQTCFGISFYVKGKTETARGLNLLFQ